MKASSLIAGLIIGALISFLLTNHFKSTSALQKEIGINDSTKWPWADSLDAIKAAPNSHKVLFENDKIRILEVTVEPYGFEPMHTHRYPSVMFGSEYDTSQFDIKYYSNAYDPVRNIYFVKDSLQEHSKSRPGASYEASYMKPEGPHRIKNLSNTRIVAFRVEFKK
jgi:hypothetical protein